MLIATLAIAAMPPFAGFFSKDLILEAAYTSGHLVALAARPHHRRADSFYMFRLIFLTFHGESRVDPEKAHHVHESPPAMTIPLIVLAVLSVVGGWVGLPEGLLWGDAFARFLAPSVGAFAPIRARQLCDADLSVSLAARRCRNRPRLVSSTSTRPACRCSSRTRRVGAIRVLLNKYYVDELYDTI